MISGNVLFLTQVLPYPLVGGAKIRAYYVIRYLSQYHRITLVSFTREDDNQQHTNHLERYCEQVITVPIKRSRWTDIISTVKSFLTGHPAVIYRDDLMDMKQALSALLDQHEYQIIHCDQTAMAQFGLYAQKLKKVKNSRLILDQHNALYNAVARQAESMSGWKYLLWKSESTRIARYEAKLIREFDSILTVSEVDKEILLSLLNEDEKKILASKFTAVPICIDPAERRYLDRSKHAINLAFLGTMYWPPNAEAVRWFAEEVLPMVLEKIPFAKLIVIGKNPPAEVRSLEARNSILDGHVQVTGFVEDPEPLLQECGVFIVPILAAGGMRVKILDAWLWGLPIASTTIGAEGVNIRPGENILIADDPYEFSESIVNILQNQQLSRSLSENGRKWVEENFNWRNVYPEIGSVYQELLVNRDPQEAIDHQSTRQN